MKKILPLLLIFCLLTCFVFVACGESGTDNPAQYSNPDTEISFVITFDADGGSAVSTQTVNYGGKAESVQTSKEGYDFLGWYKDNVLYDFDLAVTSDITLKAKWQVKTYTVMFDTDGGSAVSTQTVNYGGKAESVQTSKEGYNFLGWYKDNVLYDFDLAVTSDITLKAKWREKPTENFVTITFDVDGGSAVSNQIIMRGEKATYILSFKSGYNFLGWYKDNVLYDFDLAVTSDITLKAKWEEIIAENFITINGDNFKVISDIAGLRAISGKSNKYVLVNDIDGAGEIYENTSFLGDFSGVLDGNGYSVKNIAIKPSDKLQICALFNNMSGTVRNIGFEGITIKASDDGYVPKSGLFANEFTGTINNVLITAVYESGSVTANYCQSLLAVNAGGSTAYNVRIHVDNLPMPNPYIYALSQGDYPAHYGNYYASYTGERVNNWGGGEFINRDLGDQCLEPSKAGGDSQAIARGFSDMSFWDDNTCTLINDIYDVGEKKQVTYKVNYYFAESVGHYVLDASKSREGSVLQGTVVTVETPHFDGYVLSKTTEKNITVYKSGTVIRVYYDVDELYEHGISISTAEEFININVNKNYCLANDIDFYGAELTQISDYAGVLDGNGYSLKNFVLKRQDSYGKGGIFGNLSGTVKNIGFENVAFEGKGKNGYEYIGESGIIAYKLSGTLENIYLDATINARLRGNDGYSDFSGWNWQFGYVAFESTGATINNIVIKVSNKINDSTGDLYRFNSCIATGSYTLGNLYIVPCKGENAPSGLGGTYINMDSNWVGINNPDVLRSEISTRADKDIWNFEKKDALPYLRKGIYTPKYFYDGNNLEYYINRSGIASVDEAKNTYQLFEKITAEAIGQTITDNCDNIHFDPEQKVISIGITVISNEYAQTLGFADTNALTDYYKLGNSGFIIRTVGNTILVMGNPYYGVQELLSMLYGFEQYTDTAYTIKVKSTSSKILLGQYDIVDIPDIATRAIAYYSLTGDQNSDYRLALRTEEWLDETYKKTIIVGGHSQEMFMKTYYSSHKSWFPHGVFCWSNQNAIDAYVDYLFAIYAGEEGRSNWSNYVIVLGQCDEDKYCTCSSCKKAREAYGGEKNSAVSAQEVAFANTVADRFMLKLNSAGYVKPLYSPKIVFAIFAYMYSQEPPAIYSNGTWTPLVKMNDNVTYFFAPIRDDFSKPISENTESAEDYLGWKAVTSNEHILVWTYTTNFKNYFVNVNNFSVIGKTYQWYAENGATYLFAQGPTSSGTPTFEELRAYLDSKLLWNTSRNTELLIKDFIADYYGAGSWYVTQYLNEIRNTPVSGGIHDAIETASIWTFDKLSLLASHLDGAIAAIDGDTSLTDAQKTELKNRVYRLYCTVWYLQVDLGYGTVGKYSRSDAISMLKKYTEMYNIIQYAEGKSLTSKSWW